MKTRIVAAILVSITALTVLTACGNIKECDICGKMKPCKTEEFLGQEISICSDCEKDINDLANGLSSAFGE